MAPLAAVLGVIAVFLIVAWLISRVDGLAFMAPSSTRGMRASASTFCVDECRVDGRCPITGKTERDESCPLWRYIAADVPTAMHGSPFESLHA